MKIVYQYLKYDIFEKMIQNKTIRLSDIQKSNDSTEIKLIYGVFNEVLMEEYKNGTTKYLDTFFNQSAFENMIKDFATRAIQNNNKMHTQYVSCFSSQGDLLSQWRGYSEDYQNESNSGVSVGFNEAIIRNIVDFFNSSYSIPTKCDLVRYNSKKQKALVRDDAKNIIRELKKSVRNDNGLSNEMQNLLYCKYENAIISLNAFIKHPFFKEEKEWRIAKWGVTEDQHTAEMDLNMGCKWSCMEYSKKVEEADSRGAERPSAYSYIIMGDINDFIKEIIIGPKCTHSVEEIIRFTTKYGLKCTVNESEGKKIYIESMNHKS